MTRDAAASTSYQLEAITLAHQKCMDSESWYRARIRELEQENELLKRGVPVAYVERGNGGLYLCETCR